METEQIISLAISFAFADVFSNRKLDESNFFVKIFIEIDIQFLSLSIIMQTNTAAQFLPTISDDKKIEVSIEANEVVLKLSTWTDNLGWLCQKTMRVEETMIDDLHRVISAARYKLNQRKFENEQEMLSGKIIAFPQTT